MSIRNLKRCLLKHNNLISAFRDKKNVLVQQGCCHFRRGYADRKTTIRSQQKLDSGFNPSSYVLLVVPVATFCLGCWQVKRRKWKLNLIEELEKKTRLAPVPFPQDVTELRDLEYRKVFMRGEFDHSKELYVMPRTPVGTEEEGRGLIGGKSKSGAYVITAFNIKDLNMRVLVNRGWVPRNKLDPRSRPEGQIEGEVDLVAVVRKSEKRPVFGGKNNPAKNQWFHKDAEMMSQELDTEPIMLDADAKSTVPGGPLGGQTRVSLRNEHFSYIVTWYSLSAITLAMWYKSYWAKR